MFVPERFSEAPKSQTPTGTRHRREPFIMSGDAAAFDPHLQRIKELLDLLERTQADSVEARQLAARCSTRRFAGPNLSEFRSYQSRFHRMRADCSRRPYKEKGPIAWAFSEFVGRGERIRTSDPSVPNRGALSRIAQHNERFHVQHKTSIRVSADSSRLMRSER